MDIVSILIYYEIEFNKYKNKFMIPKGIHNTETQILLVCNNLKKLNIEYTENNNLIEFCYHVIKEEFIGAISKLNNYFNNAKMQNNDYVFIRTTIKDTNSYTAIENNLLNHANTIDDMNSINIERCNEMAKFIVV